MSNTIADNAISTRGYTLSLGGRTKRTILILKEGRWTASGYRLGKSLDGHWMTYCAGQHVAGKTRRKCLRAVAHRLADEHYASQVLEAVTN